MAKKKTGPAKVQDDHGMLMLCKGTCCGYLFVHQGRCYDAAAGQVDATAEQAATHNKLLDQAMVHGLDTTCEIGQGSSFYVLPGSQSVTTWMGTVLGAAVVSGSTVTFRRSGRQFTGRRSKDGDAINFVRTA